MFQHVGLVVNRVRPDAEKTAEQAARFFASRGVTARELNPEHPEGEAPDLVMTFGGDGTLLSGARIAIRHDVPLLGFQYGTLGFLAEGMPGELDTALQALMDGRYDTEDRSLLLVRNCQNGETEYALNDVVLTRGGYARLIRVRACINGALFDTYYADGMIVSTPTGSTGYSLSAGGPIVEPGMNCMVLTPVCPHSLQHRSLIVSATSTILFELHPDRDQTAELQVDGKNRGMLQAGDRICVTGTDRMMRLIRLRNYQFYQVMRQKLTEWGSSHA